MRRLARWLVALLTLVFGRVLRKTHRRQAKEERIVPAGRGNRAGEFTVVAMFLLAALSAIGFIVVYGLNRVDNRTQLLGITLGLSLAFVSAALITMAKLLVVKEEKEEDYPEPAHPSEQEAIEQLVEESGTPITRKQLITAAGSVAGGALMLAAITPALSLGPWTDTDPLYRTPWRRGRRLVDKDGRPWKADDIGEAFYTAYPEGASHRDMAAPLIVVRIPPSALELPAGRADWAPGGIVAYSKICTHAGCAIALYRKPTFPPVQPRRALVCPCHYSTFDPAKGAEVIFGPAGRPLPQLPLMIDTAGDLRAGGNFSGPPGPSWQGVRGERAS